MTVLEIKRQINKLGPADQIHLIQYIAGILERNTDELLLNEFSIAANSADKKVSGPIEAYEAAEQLQEFLKQEGV